MMQRTQVEQAIAYDSGKLPGEIFVVRQERQ
jgi:hypothetical protein